MHALVLSALLLASPVYTPPRASGCPMERDEEGRLKRTEAPKRAFRAVHPCPATGKKSGACPGWVIDHIMALCSGGCDAPENMQWQEVKASREKDVIELHGCGVKISPRRLAEAHCRLKTASCDTWTKRARAGDGTDTKTGTDTAPSK